MLCKRRPIKAGNSACVQIAVSCPEALWMTPHFERARFRLLRRGVVVADDGGGVCALSDDEQWLGAQLPSRTDVVAHTAIARPS